MEWCGRAVWPTMFVGITVQILKTICISFPLLTCDPRSNSSGLTFVFSVYSVWRSDWSLAQRLLQKKKNYQTILCHFCNVNKYIYQRKKRKKFFSHTLGCCLLVTINLRYNQNTRGLHLFLNNQSLFDPRLFLKNRPKKLFSNCLVDGLLTSIV